MLMPIAYRVGRWTFTVSAHELRSGQTRVRLERRTAATLSILCENRGRVVESSELIERVWGRSHLSPNSVAIVIGHLRRALDIPAGEPGSIETVRKSGYRLLAPEPEVPASSKNFGNIVAALMLLTVLIGVSSPFVLRPAALPQVELRPVQSAFETHTHDALIEASSQTLLVALSRRPNLKLFDARSAHGRPDYVLFQRWVLWNGEPELVLVAKDPNGAIAWSGSIYGPERDFPTLIQRNAYEFERFAAAHSKPTNG